jgi:hypothetical protein
VRVTVLVAVPLATTEPVPVIVELALTALPAVNVTGVERLESDAGVEIETVFTPEELELIVAVATPDALVVLEGPVNVLLLPVAASATLCPEMGFPY